MLPHHKKVLDALAIETRPYGEMCCPFSIIAAAAEMKNIPEVRRIVRHLARKGLAEYYKGLCDDGGEFRGAGYCITKQGLDVVDQEKEL